MEDESGQASPREYDYWKLDYRALLLLPGWAGMSVEERAVKLLEKIEAKLKDLDGPPQRKALFDCATEERLEVARRMLDYFEQESAN